MQSKKKMREFVIGLLKANLPDNYFYHNYKHTLYVLDIAAEIGRYEKCTVEELDLIEVAALWHDTGYIKTYKNHEEESCLLARHYLPEYGFSDKDIDKICGMIMATKIPQSPKNKLEEILADADLEYLGTESFHETADDLFRELKFINPLLTEEKWNQTQISFIQKHHFFTGFCKVYREQKKQAYLMNLLNKS
jgi:predicted metal-dependent HD superfamily phosphohydrolase